jgi:hypothetical protein
MKIAILFPLLALAGCALAPSTPGVTSAGNSIDIWKNGPPTRPYQVIATVQREGADNSATYAQEESLLAFDAKNRGADAIIILNTVMVPSRMDITDSRPIMAPKVEAELIKYE